jgi:hypothetical protein
LPIKVKISQVTLIKLQASLPLSISDKYMAIFRQYIAPLIVVLIFCAALVAVSARIFLPGDMAAPAPITEEAGGRGQGAGGNTSFLLSDSPNLY